MAEKSVPVVLADGTVGTVPESGASKVLEQGGHVASPAEVKAEQHHVDMEKYSLDEGGPVGFYEGMTGANMAGLYRGLTGGLSDVALTKGLGLISPDAGDFVRGKLNDYQEAHPWASKGMEAAGFIGGTVAGGEALGLKAAATVGGRIAQGAVRGGVEMGLYGAGKEASREALANENLEAQKIVATGAHDFGMGFLLGGGVSALAEGIGAARGALRTSKGLTESAEAPAGSLRKGLGDKLQEASDEQFLQHLGITKGQAERIARTVEGGTSRVAQDLKGVVREELGKGYASKEELAKAFDDAIAKRGQVKTDMLDALDAGGHGIAPSPNVATRKIYQEFIAPNIVRAENGKVVAAFGKEATVREAQSLIERIQSAVGDKAPTFRKWDDALRGFGDEIKFEAKNATQGTEVKRAVWGIMRGELDAAGEAAAQQAGGSFSGAYNANQKVLQSLYKGQEIVSGGVASGAAKSGFSLTSKLAGMAGASVGAAVGGPVGSLVGGAVSAGVTKLVQDRGSMFAADLLERAAGVLGTRQLAARTEAQVARSVEGWLGKASNDASAAVLAPPKVVKAAPAPASRAAMRASFEQIEKQLRQLQGNPALAAERAGAAADRVAQHSPKVAQALVATQMRGASYLASKLPASRADTYSLTPLATNRGTRASDSEIASFMRSANAVISPAHVLEDAAKGKLTHDQVDALKNVYPDLYDDIRVQVMRTLVDQKSELPYGKRIQLGILLEIPTDRTLAPDFVQALQATYSASEKAGEEPPPPNLARLDLSASSLETSTQQATQEGTER